MVGLGGGHGRDGDGGIVERGEAMARQISRCCLDVSGNSIECTTSWISHCCHGNSVEWLIEINRF